MRAAKRQLDACGTTQPLRAAKTAEPDAGQAASAYNIRTPIEVPFFLWDRR
jgi:hypothetical protein